MTPLLTQFNLQAAHCPPCEKEHFTASVLSWGARVVVAGVRRLGADECGTCQHGLRMASGEGGTPPARPPPPPPRAPAVPPRARAVGGTWYCTVAMLALSKGWKEDEGGGFVHEASGETSSEIPVIGFLGWESIRPRCVCCHGAFIHT